MCYRSAVTLEGEAGSLEGLESAPWTAPPPTEPARAQERLGVRERPVTAGCFSSTVRFACQRVEVTMIGIDEQRRVARTWRRAGAAGVALVALCSCSSDGVVAHAASSSTLPTLQSSTPRLSSPTRPSSLSASPSPSVKPSASIAAGAAKACTAGQLTVSLAYVGAFAGTWAAAVRFHNVGATTCSLRGSTIGGRRQPLRGRNDLSRLPDPGDRTAQLGHLHTPPPVRHAFRFCAGNAVRLHWHLRPRLGCGS